jgi:hypothetical protein
MKASNIENTSISIDWIENGKLIGFNKVNSAK